MERVAKGVVMSSNSLVPARRGLKRTVGLITVGVLALGLSACEAPFDSPANSSQIVKVEESVTSDGWKYELFRNLAFPCSLEGYQTFVIASKVGDSASTSRPLWVRMRGGGSGWFEADRTPFQGGENMTEDGMTILRSQLRQPGLSTRIRNHPAGFRGLAVSMCNRDTYGGANNPDPNNFDANGKQRTTNGLLATKAAIQFTLVRHATSDFFLAGGSAGSAGTYHVGWSLEEQGLAPAGIVADGGIRNDAWETARLAQGICNSPYGSPEWEAKFSPRVHSQLRAPAAQPHLLVASGQLTVPVMQVWTHGDATTCADVPMSCPIPGAPSVTMGASDCKNEPLRAAIVAQGPSGRSKSLGVCVTNGATPCNVHVSTRMELPNTDPALPADYLSLITDWVEDRLADGS